jgi:predicted RNA-binding protein with PUA-like domain
MPRRYWLAKSEPFKYSWDQFVEDRSTYWDGVRNAEARNNLATMKKGDLVLFYHSNEGDDDRWVVVDLAPVKALTEPVTLKTVKSDPKLAKIQLVTHSRLSVSPLPKPAFDRILKHGATKL